MKSWLRNPVSIFCLVLVWRVLLLVFTVQPIPANDAFGYDGAVVNLLHGGRYCNPSFALVFPISGTEVYSTYPPLYQGVLLVWMTLLGTSVVSAMVLHLVLFAIAGFITLAIIRTFYPDAAVSSVVALLFFGMTFGDRPESLGYVFGLSALWLVARQILLDRFHKGIAVTLACVLLFGLYTSVIVGAYFFGVAFLASAAVNLQRRRFLWVMPFLAAAVIFVGITLAIAKLEPLWWAGFRESASQQTVAFIGFHAPGGTDLIRLVRTAPVFVLGFMVIPIGVARWKGIISADPVWGALTLAIFIMGWAILVAAVTLLASNYVNFVVFTQVILAAGLLALTHKYFPGRKRLLHAALVACVLLVSIRAIGMSTWGVACAWKNSYQSTQRTLANELAPYSGSSSPVLLSSAYLYSAATLGVKNPVHCDWYFDHSHWTNNAPLNGLVRLQPPKMILTQFDYYRSFAPVLQTLQEHPELADFQVRNLAVVRAPDSIPSLFRVVQHISWAPVIVDLNWKNASISNSAPPSP